MSAQPSRTPNATPRKRKRRRKGRTDADPGKVTCAICGRAYRTLTASHLRTHGYTQERYARTFQGVCAPPPRPPGSAALAPRPPTEPPPNGAADPATIRHAAAHQVALELLGDDAFVASLTSEVGELLFGSELRGRLRLAVVSLLGTRLALHGDAVANLERIRAELNQPWRVEAGGKDGEPTPTPHLVAMAGEAAAEVKGAEDAFLKVAKLALEEARTHKEQMSALGGRPAYSGEAELIPVPPELTSGERETVRGLLHLLRDEMAARVEARRHPIDVQALPPPDAGLELEAPADEHPPSAPAGGDPVPLE